MTAFDPSYPKSMHEFSIRFSINEIYKVVSRIVDPAARVTGLRGLELRAPVILRVRGWIGIHRVRRGTHSGIYREFAGFITLRGYRSI